MTIENVYKYCKDQRISIYEFSKKIGVSNSYFSKQRASQGAISSKIIQKILIHYPNINVHWLITGEGDMLVPGSYQTTSSGEYRSEQNPWAVSEPMVAYTARSAKSFLGYLPLVPSNAIAYHYQDFKTFEHYYVPDLKGADFLIRIHNTTMCSTYRPGDIIACKKLPVNNLLYQQDKIYVLLTHEGLHVNRIQKAEDPQYIRLLSDNADIPSFDIPASHIKVASIAVGFIRLY